MQNLSGGTRFKCYPGPFSSVSYSYSKMKHYRNLVSYYTNKNISVSYLRAKKKNDLDRIMGLYGNMNERYW